MRQGRAGHGRQIVDRRLSRGGAGCPVTPRVPWRALGGVAVVVAALHGLVLVGWPVPPRPPVEAAATPPMSVRQLPAAAPARPARPPEEPQAAQPHPPARAAPAPARSAAVSTPPRGTGPAALAGAAPPAGPAPAGIPADPALDPAPPVAVSAAPAVAPPRYPTQPPPSFEWTYQVQRGGASGRAVLRWAREGDTFDAAMTAEVAGSAVLDWTSRGRFDAHGLAPDRFAVRRQGREMHAANFQRDKGLITYAGPSDAWPLPDGAQDRLSWMIQLAAIVDADPQRQAPGAETVIFVTGARGDAAAWTFVVAGPQAVDLPTGTVTALRVTRRPGGPRPVQAEVWLDPHRQHLPVQAVLTAADGGEPLQLVLQASGAGPR